MKKKKNKINKKLKSEKFFFEDYLETSQKQKTISKSPISDDRIYILFFLFCLIMIFFLKY